MEISESADNNTLQQLFGKTEVRSGSQFLRVAWAGYRDLLSRRREWMHGKSDGYLFSLADLSCGRAVSRLSLL